VRFTRSLGTSAASFARKSNDRHRKCMLTRYAQRMLIKNAISDTVRFFRMDALYLAVGVKADFDMALRVIASDLYRRFAQRMRGYAGSQARHVFRDLVDIPADVQVSENKVAIRFRCCAHLPIVTASGFLDQPVNAL